MEKKLLISLFILLLFLDFSFSAIPKKPSSIKVANSIKIHGQTTAKDDYYQQGHRFLQKRQYKAAVYCFEKDLKIHSNRDPYDHYWSISMAYEGLGDTFNALKVINKAIILRPGSPNAYNRSEVLRSNARFIELPEYRDCLEEIEPIDDDFWEAIEYWTNSVWLKRPSLELNPSWIVNLSDWALSCYLNRTFGLEDYFYNANTQAQIWAFNDRWQRAERLLDWSSKVYAVDSFHEKITEDLIDKVYLRQDNLEKALELTKKSLKTYPNNEWMIHTEAHIYHGLGDLKNMEKSLKKSWTIKLRDWLMEKPKRNCRRSLVNWFNDPEVIVSKPISLIDLIPFGFTSPKYIETEENLANPVAQQMNLTYIDRAAYVLKFTNVELLPEFQIRSDCKRYYGILVGDETPKESNRPVVEVDRLAITAPMQSNFFHNMLDSAARLAVLMYEIFSKDEFLDVMLMMDDNPTTRSVLELLKFPLARVGRFQPHKNIYKVKELFVVDWKPIYDITANERAIQSFVPPRWTQMMLRQWELEGFDRLYGHLVDKIPGMIDVVYVSRSENSIRSVRNELFLISQLREALESVGAQLHIHRGDESLAEQVALFKIADVIVGPHGAGFANIIYCYPGTTVIEFPVRHPHWDVFGYMAASLDLDYWIIPEMTGSLQGHFTADRKGIEATVTSVLVALELKGLI